MRSETKLTSVKIISDLYKKFRSVALNEEFTLQKLVNRSMDKYLKDEEYKKSIVSNVLVDLNQQILDEETYEKRRKELFNKGKKIDRIMGWKL